MGIEAQRPYCIRKSDFKCQKPIYNARFLQPLDIFTYRLLRRLRLKRRHVIYNLPVIHDTKTRDIQPVDHDPKLDFTHGSFTYL